MQKTHPHKIAEGPPLRRASESTEPSACHVLEYLLVENHNTKTLKNLLQDAKSHCKQRDSRETPIHMLLVAQAGFQDLIIVIDDLHQVSLVTHFRF